MCFVAGKSGVVCPASFLCVAGLLLGAWLGGGWRVEAKIDGGTVLTGRILGSEETSVWKYVLLSEKGTS
jgi:hypothetical protein